MLLPKSSSYVSGEVSIFDTLVRTGEARSLVTFSFQLRTFLVNCLVEHLRDRAIGHQVLALGLLSSATKSGESSNLLLKRTGDAALLLAGLFPERSRHLHVSSTYFRHMGQAAYATLAAKFQVTGKPLRGRLYDDVTEHFQSLERVLGAARRPDSEWESYQRFRARI